MDVFTKNFKFSETVDDILGKIFRVRGRETNSLQPSHGTESPEKGRKAETWTIRSTVGIHVMAEQGDLLNSLADQTTYLLPERMHGTTPFSSPDIRHNAISTIIVAAFHDRHIGPDPVHT